METAVKSIVSFDRFTINPTRRVLLKDGEIVNLNPKTFDLLLALIEQQGEVVRKNELMNTENEITIESHKFERVIIEEEIEDEPQENGKTFRARELNESYKSKTNYKPAAQILL